MIAREKQACSVCTEDSELRTVSLLRKHKLREGDKQTTRQLANLLEATWPQPDPYLVITTD